MAASFLGYVALALAGLHGTSRRRSVVVTLSAVLATTVVWVLVILGVQLVAPGALKPSP